MNSKHFILFLATALALAPLGGSAAEPPPNPFFAFDNGVGREAKWSPADQASSLKALGYDGIGYTGLENFAERQKEFQDQGLKIFSLYVPCFVDRPEAYSAQFKQAIPRLQGTGVLLWLTVQGKATNDVAAVRIVREIGDLAAASGVRVALYPHKGFFVATTEDALRITRQVGRTNVGVSLNLCHELAAGNGPRLDAIAKDSLPYLYLVSINGADHKGGWNELIRPLDEGSFDVGAFMRSLRAQGYTGPVGLQCYNVKGDQRDNLKRSMTAWKMFNR